MSSALAAYYCIDGTNLVRSAGYGGSAFRAQEEADARRLVSALDQVCAALGPRVEIEIFFDGEFRGAAGRSANLRVRYARELSADELIMDRVLARGRAGQGRVTVVTGDGELGERAAAEGGRWQRAGRGATLESVVRAIEARFRR